MTHAWVRHVEHGGYWQCPVDLLDEMQAKGWEPSDPPVEPNPAVAERIAWERELAEQAAARAEAEKKPKTTKAARRGESPEESES